MEGGNGKRNISWESWQISTAQDTGLYRCPSPRVYTDEGRSNGDVMTKFSRLDRLPILITHGASLDSIIFINKAQGIVGY